MVTASVSAVGTIGLTVAGGYFFGPAGAAAGAVLGSFLFIQLGTTAILVTSSTPGGVFTADVWYYVEIEAFVHDTTGFVLVYLDGNLLVEIENADTRGQAGTDLVEMIRFHGNTGGGTGDGPNVVNIDDIYLLDDSTRLGQCRVSTLLPNADTADADWTPLGAGSHFAEVDDDNGDTSYIASDTIGDLDVFDAQDLPFTPRACTPSRSPGAHARTTLRPGRCGAKSGRMARPPTAPRAR